VFFLEVERESVGREWGLVGKTVPPHDLIPHRFAPSCTGPVLLPWKCCCESNFQGR
jgi:hypothetical protein